MNTCDDGSIKIVYDCIPCAIGSLITLFEKGVVPQQQQADTMRALLQYLSQINFNGSPPILGKEMHRVIRNVLHDPDPYYQIKKQFNALLLQHYEKLKSEVDAAADPFQAALRLAIAGNIIDYGANRSFDIDETLHKAKTVQFAVDHSLQLKQALNMAQTLLYLGDNAGEIVLDRILIETIKHPHVYFAVRESPIINDATMEDAQQVGMDKVATVISNGDDAPGTVLSHTSPEFRKIFEQADLIISKGQGNFEGLSSCRKNIYFLLMAKCHHVAHHLGVSKGDFVVKRGA